MDYEKDLKLTRTNIPGLVVVDLSVHGDNRGWFKENWQRAKMIELGIPADFMPVQNNISFNDKRGVTRGIHAEPWDKFISVAAGEIFGAWVDLRPGASFGQVYTTHLDPSKAIFVPRGVGNAFQTLIDGTAYTYLVNAHWSAAQKSRYTFVNLADPTLNIQWPISLDEAELSEADKRHPMLAEAKPMEPKRTMVIGSHGQLGRAIAAYVDGHDMDDSFDFHDIDTFDISDADAFSGFDWALYGTIINASAYTAVDMAETAEGRVEAWKANVTGVANLAKVASDNNLTLVHISSDYVFDGTADEHDESELFSPLGVYGQTKAAGDALVAQVPKHYIVRSSWVIGDGKNFVKTMMALAGRAKETGKPITVVDDQYGRLTFTDDMVRGIFHLLDSRTDYGTYNLTGSGTVVSWQEVAREVFELCGISGNLVEPISTAEYNAAQAGKLIAPRPEHSALDLGKMMGTGYVPRDWEDELREYCRTEAASVA
jgi:dTDP-4-dehydrorhamnose 3,5-epimerase